MGFLDPIPGPRPVAIAHRGAHDEHIAENSVEAIALALKLGAEAVEFDVCNTRDGRLLVTHDRRVKVAGRLVDVTVTDAADLPGLSDVTEHLELVAESTDVLLNFDWKGDGYEDRVGELLREHALTERTIISGTDPTPLARVKQLHPETTIGLSVVSSQALIDRMDGCGAAAAMVWRGVLTQETVARLRSADRAVFTWTASDVPTFEGLAALEPDGIATDVIADQLSQS